MTDLSIELHRLFSEGNYTRLVALIPALEPSDLSTGERLTLGLALFNIARTNQALCQIAIAAERAQSSEERRICIHYLVEILGLLGKDYEVEYCLQELEFLGQDTPTQSSSNRLISLPILDPLHIQAEKFPKTSLFLPSLSRICMESYAKCQETVSETTQFTTKSKLSLQPLHSLYRAIISCPPMYVFNDLNSKSIDTILQELKKSMPDDIDLSSPSQIFYYVETSTALQTLEFLDKVAHIRLIAAFSAKLQNLTESNDLLLLIISLIEEVRKSHPLGEFLLSHGRYLNDTTKNVALIHLACNLSEVGTFTEIDDKTLSYLEELCYRNDIYSEYESGRLWQYYSYAAMFYERLAYKECSIVNIWRNELMEEVQGVVPQVAIRLNFDHLRTMSQRIIVAVTALPRDDPAAVFLYCRLFWALLMMGGISYTCLYIFRSIRDYFIDHFASGPLQLGPDSLHCEFFEKDVLGDLLNGCKIADVLCSMRETTDANNFLTPQVFIHNEALLASQYFFDEKFQSRDLQRVSRTVVKPVRKGQLKLDEELTRTRHQISTELVDLWCNSYLRYYQALPLPIRNVFQRFTANKST